MGKRAGEFVLLTKIRVLSNPTLRFIRKEVVLNYCTHLPAKKNNINPIDFFINFLFIIYKYKNSSAIFIISRAIAQILSNHQSGDRLTYSGLSKELHRGKPFVKKVLERMIEERLARYDEDKRSIFLL
jgi:hypothetical protein